MRTKLREYSYLYLLAASSSISGVGAFLRGSWGFTQEATICLFLPCLIVGSFASWRFLRIHRTLKAAEEEADANGSASQNKNITKEFNEA